MPDTHGFSDDFLAGLALTRDSYDANTPEQAATLIAKAKTHYDAVLRDPARVSDYEWGWLSFFIINAEHNWHLSEQEHTAH